MQLVTVIPWWVHLLLLPVYLVIACIWAVYQILRLIWELSQS